MLDTFYDRDLLRKNNFGAMRLAFALSVIISHTFAAFGGTVENGEPLMRATGKQMDLGGLAVNGFFAISGYLITLSWLRTPKITTFLMKRALRIYPAFILASLLSLLIVAPLAGAKFSVMFAGPELRKSIIRLLALSAPGALGAFANEPWPVLNLSLWTIRYEFLCYLLVPVICFLGLRSRRSITMGLYLAFLGWHASQGAYLVTDGFDLPFLGSTAVWPRFLSYFLGGMIVAQNRELIPFRSWIFFLCIAVLIITGIFGGFFIAFATAGIYAVFYIAYQRAVPMLGVGDRRDFSYGSYLYGWPVQMLIVHYFRDSLGPWQVIALSIPGVLIMAIISWYAVESPCLRTKAKLIESKATDLPAPDGLLPAPPPPVAVGGAAEAPDRSPITPYRRSA